MIKKGGNPPKEARKAPVCGKGGGAGGEDSYRCAANHKMERKDILFFAKLAQTNPVCIQYCFE
jgi:hypothetical protein